MFRTSCGATSQVQDQPGLHEFLFQINVFMIPSFSLNDLHFLQPTAKVEPLQRHLAHPPCLCHLEEEVCMASPDVNSLTAAPAS